MIFDTHAHYLDHRFDEDRDNIINSLKTENVTKVCEISADADDFIQIVDHIDKYDMFYGSLGVHPSVVDKLTEDHMDMIKKLSTHKKIVAIGEIGLDYHFDDDPEPEVQKKWFIRQLEIANELELPVIIHSRDAAKETIDILKEYHRGTNKEPKKGFNGGVIHCYSYSPELALEFIEMGYYIGLDGPVTFKNGKKAKEVAKVVPEDRLVVETDCPYMSPEPHRGSRNSSLNLKYIIAEIANLREKSYEEMEEILYNNSLRLYNIK
ncbi:MAG: TatD family hydrolase [Lachnospiraceae bacterium]|nr:TatD family hydrolase [Lachnospiraceae bacterium]